MGMARRMTGQEYSSKCPGNVRAVVLNVRDFVEKYSKCQETSGRLRCVRFSNALQNAFFAGVLCLWQSTRFAGMARYFMPGQEYSPKCPGYRRKVF